VLNERFILGLDLDGTCADFYGRMREVAAQFTGRPLEDLPEEVDWSLSAWGIGEERYEELHRYAVTEHGLFESMAPLPGSTEALRRLVGEGVGVRVITHRLILPSLHAETVRQTVRWLDEHRIPYWDLCFMRAKDGVDADLYVEDSSSNIERLLEVGADVLVIDNPTNRHHEFPGAARAGDWEQAEAHVRARYLAWLDARGLERPPAPGESPSWFVEGNAPRSRRHGR
jgi:uncharacterized HAD superfamily protein